MYQELHMWDECIVVAKAKVQSTAAWATGWSCLVNLVGSPFHAGSVFFSPALPCFCLEGLK